MIKVVLDTNLFAAARWNSRSASAKIIESCLKGELQAYYTPEIEKELWIIMRNIRADDEYRSKVSNYLGRAEKIVPWAQVDIKVEDPEDQKFIICAVSADVDYLITSDDHLLRLGTVHRTEIIKPADFWRDVLCRLKNS